MATRTVTARFNSRSDAEDAVERLVSAGVPRLSISLTQPETKTATDTTSLTSSARESGGFLDRVVNRSRTDEGRYTRSEGVRHGSVLLCVRVDDALVDETIGVLERSSPIDFNNRAEKWRGSGWQGHRVGLRETIATPTPADPAPPGTTGADAIPSAAQAVGTATSTDRAREDDETAIPVDEEQLRGGGREVGGDPARQAGKRGEGVRSVVEETAAAGREALKRELGDALGSVKVLSAAQGKLVPERALQEWRPERVALPSALVPRLADTLWAKVKSIAFSPDAHLLASVGADDTCRLWDVASGRQIRASRAGSLCGMQGMAFSPDGKLLAAGTKLLDVGSGQTRRVHDPDPTSFGPVTFSPDGSLQALGRGSEVLLVDVPTGREVRTFENSLGRRVVSVAFSPDGRLLTSAYRKPSSSNDDGPGVGLWCVASGREIRAFGPTAVSDVAFSPDGRLLASGGPGGLKVQEAVSGRAIWDAGWAAGDVQALAFSPDGRSLAAAAKDGRSGLWDVASGRFLSPLSGRDDLVDPEDASASINAVTFSPDGSFLATGGEDGTIRFRDAHDGRELRALTGHGRWSWSWFAFSTDGSLAAVSGPGKPITLWEVRSGRKVRAFAEGGKGSHEETFALALSADSRLLAGERNGVHLWDVASGSRLRTLWDGRPGTDGQIRAASLAFSADGRFVAVGFSNCRPQEEVSARVWEVDSGRELPCLRGRPATLNRVTFSPDGRLLASTLGVGEKNFLGSPSDTVVRVSEVASGQEIRRFSAPLSTSFLSFSPDGRMLGSGDYYGFTLWDLASGAELPVPRNPEAWIDAVTILPGGRLGVVGDVVGDIRLWR